MTSVEEPPLSPSSNGSSTKKSFQPPDLSQMHAKIQSLFRGKESKLRMIDEWVLMETLGMGGYSKVKLGLHCKTGQKAALKIMFADQSGKMSSSKKKQLLRELNVMKKVNHPNVIKLMTYNAEAKYPEANGKATPCIMTALEFAAGGELFDYLMYTGHFDDAATRSYFKQLIDGLEAMHGAGIAHRDLKPENLLMDSSFTLKIADFGFATEFIDKMGKEKLMKTPCGTKNYLAPEFWEGKKYSYKCDIFAAGIILFTTYAGFPPFMEAQPNDWWWDKYSIALQKLKRANVLRQIIKSNPSLKDSQSAESKEMEACLTDARKRMQLFWKAHSKKRTFDDDDFKDIALNLIHPNPDKRMEIKQIAQHKWFIKGPFYNKDELKLYLTKRVKTVLQGRARKIRTLMQQPRKQEKTAVRPIADIIANVTSAEIARRIKQIDPKHGYDSSCESVKDAIFPDTMFQFFTNASPAEMAVRIESVAFRNQAEPKIDPAGNLITIQCGYAQTIEMPDGVQVKREEKITFIVKQFFIDNPPKLEEGQHLFDKDDVSYLVSFKRLQGTFPVYAKIVKRLMEDPDIAEKINFKDMIGDENDTKIEANGNNDDEKSVDNQ